MHRFSSVGTALEALQAENAALERKLAAVQRGHDAEAALDAVWTQALGIEHSDDTLAVAVAIHDALCDLGVPVLQVGLTGHVDRRNGEVPVWIAGVDGDGVARANHRVSAIVGHPLLDTLFGEETPSEPVEREMTGDDFAVYLRASLAQYPPSYAERVIARAPVAEHVYAIGVSAKTGQSGPLLALLSAPPRADTIRTLERFAILFGLAYARYRDVQRAEEQARTAQIDAVLERVRARALSMERSDEFDAVVEVVFGCLGELGIEMERSTLALVHQKKGRTTFWSSATLGASTTVDMALLDGHPFYDAIWRAVRQQDDLVYILEGKELELYSERLHRVRPDLAEARGRARREYVYVATIPRAVLAVFALRPFSEDTVQVIQRVAHSFGFARDRRAELVKAERRARIEAQEASVDRIRAEIATMRTVADLDRVTPLLWDELTVLGVPFVQCGVLVVDEAAGSIQALYSTSDGALTVSIAAHPIFEPVIAHWREREPFTETLERDEAAAWQETLGAHGLGRADEETPERLAIHFAPFAQGLLYVGSSAPIRPADRSAVHALADAFEVAYARYDDFQRLEARRHDLQTALDDLRATQQRLVQSEKLASLGALTAGIAHEIKNPLNFVNNFASLSREIVDDLTEEMAEGNQEDVAELLQDLRLNAERIELHGRRADDIVRSMMQHARGTDGEREHTPIDPLAEQNVNLAYHGRRAQEGDFNVTFANAFDAEGAAVDIVAQEIGRVLINLVNNAFDAVMSRKEDEAAAGNGDFEPTVSVRTARRDGNVVVWVEDNGTGVAQDDLDRIFEPFYTTKAPGKGTGLGLSMSHEIVQRGHGGTLTVESTLGRGTTFVMTLPAV